MAQDFTPQESAFAQPQEPTAQPQARRQSAERRLDSLWQPFSSL